MEGGPKLEDHPLDDAINGTGFGGEDIDMGNAMDAVVPQVKNVRQKRKSVLRDETVSLQRILI